MVSRSPQMVSPVVRRILWKEYRSQSAVCLAIALELLLIQFWWATFGFQSLSIYGLFGATWVMSGVLALTTSALLFAAESEAGTDSLFRQWPVRVRDMLTGKLGYGVLSVTAMIVFGVLTTFFTVSAAGRLHPGLSDGLWSSGSIGHARSVVGLFAWGVFYSILTRNVLWTLALGALTEILAAGILEGMTGAGPFGSWMDSLGYVAIVVGVMAVDRRLLLRWIAFENDVPVITSMWTTNSRPEGTVVGQTSTSTVSVVSPVSRLQAYRWSYFVGALCGLVGTAAVVGMGLDGSPPSRKVRLLPDDAVGLLLVILMTGVAVWRLWPFAQVRKSEDATGAMSGRRSAGRFSRTAEYFSLAAVIVPPFVLGVTATYITLIILLMSSDDTARTQVRPSGSYASLAFLIALVSTLAVLAGDSLLRSMTACRTTGWLRLLHFLQSTSGIIGRGTSSLIWIEIRRATPVLFGGWLVLALVTRNPWSSVYVYGGWQAGMLELISMMLAGVLCGLMTILPDRAGGTLLFLSQRGVSATGILASKIAVWGVTFALMVIPSVLFGQYFWPDLVVTDWYGAQEFLAELIRQGEFPTVTRILSQTRGLCLTALLLGTFTAGVLAAEWIRRQILACSVAVPLTAVWCCWMSVIVGSCAPFGSFIVFPLVMIWVGIFWTGTTSILGHTTWRSRLGRAAWLPLIALITLHAFRDFRAYEIPPVSHRFSPEVLREPAHHRYGRSRPDDLLTLGMAAYDGPIRTFGQGLEKSMDLPGTGDAAEISRVQFLDRLSEPETAQQSLVQIQTYWNSVNYFRSAIRELRLADDVCDLDASFEHLLKWLRLTEQMGDASRNVTGWGETLVTRRVIYAAIRRWAGHPHQTHERLRSAAERFLAANGPECPVAVKPMAREYAAVQRINGFRQTGPSGSGDLKFTAKLARRIAIISGEHERSRRLVDYYYHLMSQSTPDQPATAGREYEFWVQNTLHLLRSDQSGPINGSVPPRWRGEWFWLARSSGHATYLILSLQAWRLEHGQFPASLPELPGDAALTARMTTDPLAQQMFGYESTGLSLDLQTSPVFLVSGSQPILYSLGLSEPRGLRETSRLPPANESDLIIQARNWDGGKRQFIGQPSPLVDQPAHPASIRFVIFGQTISEDSLADSPAEDQAESSVSE